jgi:hypothetical protein
VTKVTLVTHFVEHESISSCLLVYPRKIFVQFKSYNVAQIGFTTKKSVSSRVLTIETKAINNKDLRAKETIKARKVFGHDPFFTK